MESALADTRRDAARPQVTISPARSAAFEVLMLVEHGRGHSDELLHGRGLKNLSTADKALATALALGVLRWQIALDARIKLLLAKPDTKLDAPVAIALRMGAFQLLHMDRIPAHAALSESVELVRADAAYATGLVNAVLRKLSQQPTPAPKVFETTPAFAERLGHPAWMVERWVKAYGRAATLAICEADQREPACGELFLPEADGAEMPVMDDGSRLVAELTAASMPDAARVWDCCAAPGGKTLVVAHRLPNAAILATDASPRRLKALTDRLTLAGVSERVRTEEGDAAEPSESFGQFDLILCDVPCSGTGTLGRNPEIRHRMTPTEFSRQAQRQKKILGNALQRLRPGGRLVYATCSLELEENEHVVSEVLGKTKQVTRLSVEPLLEGITHRLKMGTATSALVRDGYLRTLPGNNMEADGFFAAVMERTAKG